MATQQEVIKAFIKSLDTTSKSGKAAVDAAVKACSSFGNLKSVIAQLIGDCQSATDVEAFLKEKCGIILDNKDTGAITGSDAGGSKAKTAESIVPESGKASYPSGTSFTKRGLKVIVPKKNKLTKAQQTVVQGLYSWWIDSALDLIENTLAGASIQTSSGNDTINNSGNYVTIDSGAGNDDISNVASSVAINAGKGDDEIYNSGDNVSINGGNGNNVIDNQGSPTIEDDSISWGEFNHNVTIETGAGKDFISNFYAEKTKINSRAGNDTVYMATLLQSTQAKATTMFIKAITVITLKSA